MEAGGHMSGGRGSHEWRQGVEAGGHMSGGRGSHEWRQGVT